MIQALQIIPHIHHWILTASRYDRVSVTFKGLSCAAAAAAAVPWGPSVGGIEMWERGLVLEIREGEQNRQREREVGRGDRA